MRISEDWAKVLDSDSWLQRLQTWTICHLITSEMFKSLKYKGQNDKAKVIIDKSLTWYKQQILGSRLKW